MIQVQGTLVEGGTVVDNLEITGKWDQELVVKHPSGEKEMLWSYKAPAYVDIRYILSSCKKTRNPCSGK